MTNPPTMKNMNPQVTARIHEQGNGLPHLGGLVYDSSEGAVYRIIGWAGRGNIHTHPLGDYVAAECEYVGDASDLDEDEWAEVSECRMIIT